LEKVLTCTVFSGEGDLPVGVVRDDPEAVAVRELRQPMPLLGGEAALGGVVEVRDRVERADRIPGGEALFELVHVDPIGLDGDRGEVPGPVLEDAQEDREDRVVHCDQGILLDQSAHRERQALLAARGHQDPVRGDALPRGDPLAQRRDPLAARVLEGLVEAVRILLQPGVGAGELRGGQGLMIRDAGDQRDRIGGR
jgi:hypothetical protein